MALGMVGLGVAAQWSGAGLRQASSANDHLLDALLAAPASNPIEQVRAVKAPAPMRRAREALSLAEPDQGPELPLEIRVGLVSLGGSPALSASGPWQLRRRNGEVLQQGQAGETVSLPLARSADETWLVTTGGGTLLANGNPYGGVFRLLDEAGGLRLVNHLPLERYIAAVVGAEMPSSWPLEALKAQAVAARSYALAHMARPANRHWHLGDTTRWQAYRGLGRVNARTLAAAGQTAGLILSYQGGIVESLYAANSQITLEAHGHLGASMSQQGARALAEAGHRYNAILGRYYPGASLARLRAGAR
jgi:stage II sporulation protein D